MLLHNILQAQLKLKAMRPPFSSAVASFAVEQFSMDLFSSDKVENPHKFSEQEIEAFDGRDDLTLDEEIAVYGRGWDKVSIDIGESKWISESPFYATIARRIKLYTEEDERILSVKLYYKDRFADDLSIKFDYYLNKKNWDDTAQQFLVQVKNIAPVKIDTKDHFDFVGLC